MCLTEERITPTERTALTLPRLGCLQAQGRTGQNRGSAPVAQSAQLPTCFQRSSWSPKATLKPWAEDGAER